MQERGLTETEVYISKQKEKIVIDDGVIAVLKIVDEIIEKEKLSWRKKIFTKIRKGCKDVVIIAESPIERTKYYDVKNELIDKVFHFCIFKGLVCYEDILESEV